MEGSPLYSVLWGLDPTYVLASQADRGLIFGDTFQIWTLTDLGRQASSFELFHC